MRRDGWMTGLCSMVAVALATVVTAGAIQHEPNAAATMHRETNALGDMAEGVVYLYFTDPATGFLSGEIRQIEPPGDVLEAYRQIIDELIRGPNGDLVPTIPPDMKVRAIYRGDGGTVYVDLTGNVSDAHPLGVRSELLTVYSIVNTLILNADGVNAVKILINGNEADTLAGHVDISLPLKAQMLLVR